MDSGTDSGVEVRTFQAKAVAAAIAFAVVACQQPAATPPAPATSAPETSAPAVSVPEISIESISATNPVIVRGRARSFENAVSVRVRDAAGELLAEGHTTSSGEMGQHNPYELSIFLVRDPGARITVEAFEYSAKDGSVRSLTRETRDYAVPLIASKLVFPTSDCEHFTTLTRRMPKSAAMARLIVEALVAGPTAAERASGATSPFPNGSAVNSVILRDGILTVDFNERLQNVGGSCAALAIRHCVEETLRQFASVKQIVITAGGSRELALQP